MVLTNHKIGAKFNDPDKTHSKAVVDGVVISWDQWATDNFNEYHELRGFLEKWAIEQDKAGRNVFGYGIKLKSMLSRPIIMAWYRYLHGTCL